MLIGQSHLDYHLHLTCFAEGEGQRERDVLDGPANNSCFNSEASPWRGALDRERSDVPNML